MLSRAACRRKEKKERFRWQDLSLTLASGWLQVNRSSVAPTAEERWAGGGGAVKRAIIDLVLISGPCVLDPLQDRMTVFGFVLARDKND